MADLLIRHLEEKGKEHSALALLVNQWEFDAKLIPKALQSVGNLFPHYSRHDESHSKQILINIERLLGESIAQLTATDTWLLLEAAYWHDIGMVVPQQDIASALALPAFQQYLSGIRNDPRHELSQFAEHFDGQDMSRCFGGAETPLEAVEKFRQLMAEWFRRQHADRSERIVQAPSESVGLNSPRTELIPARLYRLLGRICRMHGLPFAALLAPTPSGLPFKEVGLGVEDCHPRFVACLLRMGDLLDLDDNRFCPVMQRIAGDNRPKTSKAHEDKHASIRHLRIDRERIEITAECETLDGYLETFKWFDWLKQEVQDQMANWQRIVPSRTFGLLPTLGSIAVRMSGELQILNEGQRPQFSIDSANATALLQGSNLYTTKFACIRELLQNAVDATLLRLWLTEADSIPLSQLDSPFSPAARDLLNSAKVEVEIEEAGDAPSVPEGKTAWTLTITDRGTGISRKDLGYMLKIGGSQSNVERQERINRMPEWMKPSGAFGIGFQSAFLICEELTLVTKSIFTNETLKVTMHSPTGCNEGLVLLRVLDNDVSQKNGTTITVRLLADTFAESWTYNAGEEDSLALQIVNSLDPVLDEAFPFDAARLADEVAAFAVQSPISIQARFRTSSGRETIVTEGLPSPNQEQWNFVKARGHALAIKYQPAVNQRFPNRTELLYRGQLFKHESFYLPHVRVAANLMSGKAGSWLTANRDTVANHAIEELEETVLAALAVQVQEDLRNHAQCPLLQGAFAQQDYSFFLEAMALRFGGEWVEFAKHRAVHGKWIDLRPAGASETFRHFFDKPSWTLGLLPSAGEPPTTGCDLLLGDSWADYTKIIVLNEWQKIGNRSIQVLEPDSEEGEYGIVTAEDREDSLDTSSFLKQLGRFRLRYRLSTDPQPAYSIAALATRLADLTRRLNGNSRYILNCDNTWSRLYLRAGTQIRARGLFDTFPNETSQPVLLPFLFKNAGARQNSRVEVTSKQLDELCEWVRPHLVSSALPHEIRMAYEDLIRYIDDKVMEPSPYWNLWKTARGIS